MSGTEANSNLIKRVHGWREATVHAKNTVVDDSRHAQVVEDFSTILPDIHTTIFLEAFIIKTVDLRDLPRLVVASNESDTIRVSHLNQNISSLCADEVKRGAKP